MFRISTVFLSLLFGLTANAQTIAKIGEQTISKADFEKSYKEAVKKSASLNTSPTRAEHLEDMIRFRVGLQEAKKQRLQASPIVKKALDLTLYKGLLEVNLSKSVEKIKVSEKEMRSYYKSHPYMRSSHIFIRMPQNPNAGQVAEAQKRAAKLASEVQTKKKPWEVYVRMYSDDIGTKTKAGDLGYHSSKSLHPLYYAGLKKLAVSSISAPVRGPYGFHIIKKTGQLSFERSDQNAVKLAVFNEKRFRIFDKYFEGLKKKYKVSENKDLL